MKKNWTQTDAANKKKFIHKTTDIPMQCSLCPTKGLNDFFELKANDITHYLCENCFTWICAQSDFRKVLSGFM